MTAPPEIFLSYNREDAAVAKAYAEAFAREGFDVWWDATLRSGETYDEVTEAALRAAKAVVVLWSPRSVASRWVRAEATIAHRKGTLMPVTIESCDRPVMFELTQTAELAHWRGAADDKAWQAFLGDVRRMVGRSKSARASIMADPAPAPPSVGSGAPSIVAVLPFTCRAGDNEMEILAEDLTEEITRKLAQEYFINVIAAGKLAAWRGKTTDYRVLERELEARYLIEGKLQRAGEDVRLTVQVIDAVTANAVWSNRFVSKPADIAASPEEFPIAVAFQLSAHIFQFEVSRAMTKQGPLSGWEHMLRAFATPGRQLGSASLRNALDDARKAVSLAPDLGLAHAVLAALLATTVTTGGMEKHNDAQRREIYEHIQRAMLLDGDSVRVLTAVVSAHGVLGDWETSLRLARRAVEIDPNSAHALFALGRAHYMMGRTDEAAAAFNSQLRIALDSNRASALQLLGLCLCIEGKLAEAEVALDQSLTLNPSYGAALMWKAVIAAKQGQEQAARSYVLRLREAEPGMSIDQHVRGATVYPLLRERTVDAVATFRRLWDETEGAA